MDFVMSNMIRPVIYGEVLFDCFPNGEQVLGGAPFNVAWHLQAFGDQPSLISRVGNDEMGRNIISAMEKWGMDTASVQVDSQHQTGRVDIAVIENEPHYTITPDCAYDFIDIKEIKNLENTGILYHGTLGLRNTASRQTFERLASMSNLSIFLDVNLRPPWWEKDQVCGWLEQARWVKLNTNELQELGAISGDVKQDMAEFQARYDIEILIVTRGADGAIVRTRDGALYSSTLSKPPKFIDTVGAGDAFTAVFIHGLISNWPLNDTLDAAQHFASAVVGLRGAISSNTEFYREFKN
jgi:fructokinase